MAYAAYTDIEVETGKTFASAQQTRCNSMLTRVSSYIDGKLKSVYATPFTSPYPDLIVECCILLTAGRFLLGALVDQPQKEAVEARAEALKAEGETLLEALRTDRTLLEGSTAVLRSDGDTITAPQLRVSSYPSSITLRDSSQWQGPVADTSFVNRGVPTEYP